MIKRVFFFFHKFQSYSIRIPSVLTHILQTAIYGRFSPRSLQTCCEMCGENAFENSIAKDRLLQRWFGLGNSSCKKIKKRNGYFVIKFLTVLIHSHLNCLKKDIFVQF